MSTRHRVHGIIRGVVSATLITLVMFTTVSAHVPAAERLGFQFMAKAVARAESVESSVGIGPVVGTIGAGECKFFAETRRTVCDEFLSYWNRYGGLSIFGFPLSWELTEDGRTVQYFERAKLEYHTEAAGTDWSVMGELVGRTVTSGRENEAPFQPLADLSVPGGCAAFAETGHTLCGGFHEYWSAHGGVWMFGYPISQEFQEKNPDTGKRHTVQYFERARFEWHPDNPTEHRVLLGRIGHTLHSARYKTKYQDLVNVKDFGATGDGATDDSEAFRAAFAAARAAFPARMVIYVPNGVYRLEASENAGERALVLPRHTVLVGESIQGTTIKMIGASVQPDWGNIRFIRLAKGARITNMTVDGSRTEIDRNTRQWMSAALIFTRRPDVDVTIEHLRVHDAYGQKSGDQFQEAFGVFVGSDNTVVRNVEAFNNDGSGVNVAGTLFGYRPKNVAFDSIYVHGNKAMGISAYSSDFVTITRVNAERNRRGINIEWSSDITVRNSRTVANDWYGISVAGGSHRLGLANLEISGNGTDTGYSHGGEIGINAHTWWHHPDPNSGIYPFSIAQNVSVINSAVTPSANRPHVSMQTEVRNEHVPATQVGPTFTEELLLHSPNATSWSFLIDGNTVSTLELPNFVMSTFGLAIRLQ